MCLYTVSGRHPKFPAKKTKWVSSTPDVGGQFRRTVYVIKSKSSPPYGVELQVNNHKITMEVDTRAAVSLAPESAVASLL